MSERISTLAGISVPYSQCGFRLMNLEAWNRLQVEASHFEIESEVLLAFARAGWAIEFAPIEVIYKSEQSKIHPVRDTLRWVKWWKRVCGPQRPGNAEHRTSNAEPRMNSRWA